MDHSASSPVPRPLWGPYESCPSNPVLKPPPSDEYVQTVGHADFVQDAQGNWWAVALGTRIEKDHSSPMGRETYLLEGVWPEGDWPSFTQPVRVVSSSDRLPPAKPELDRVAAFQHAGSLDAFSTEANPTKFSPHWIFVRNPVLANYQITSTTSLALTPTEVTLSANWVLRVSLAVVRPPLAPRKRRSSAGTEGGVEAGFTVFLTPFVTLRSS